MSPDGTKLYVREGASTSGITGSLKEINTTTMTITGQLDMGITGYPVMNSDGSYIYLANWDTPKIDVVDTLSFTITNTIDLPSTASGMMVLSDDDKKLYVRKQDDCIYVISTLTNEVIGTIPFAVGNMDITCNGEYLYVTLPQSKEVAKISTSSKEIVDRIAIANEGGFLALSPDDNHLYMTNPLEDTVTIIRLN